jgi:hypothetical protein
MRDAGGVRRARRLAVSDKVPDIVFGKGGMRLGGIGRIHRFQFFFGPCSRGALAALFTALYYIRNVRMKICRQRIARTGGREKLGKQRAEMELEDGRG